MFAGPENLVLSLFLGDNRSDIPQAHRQLWHVPSNREALCYSKTRCGKVRSMFAAC